MRLVRMFGSPTLSGLTALTDWTKHPKIAGVGEINDLELRVQGPALEAWVNGQRVCETFDPVLGIGFVGMRAECSATATGSRSLVWSGFETRAVTA